jgi:hypothetical protein
MVLVGLLTHTWIDRSKTIGERLMRHRMNEALADRDEAIRVAEKDRERAKAANQRAARYAKMIGEIQRELYKERASKTTVELTPASSP